METQSQVKKYAQAYHREMIDMRRHLHQHPEVSFKEFETTQFIKSELKKLNIPYESPLETGCVGILKGGVPSNRVIALRADIDALPIDEEGDAKAEFISKNAGVAHCCGHDAHTANLIGVAKILSEFKNILPGIVLLVFQPAEERLPGGASLLCETGFLQALNVQAIYGLHTSPFLKPGTVATRNGVLMASPDEFEIEIIGKGGHAASPHTTIDPIVLSAQFVTAVQSIVSRNTNPTDSAVVTIGKIEGGTIHNIIPERVTLWGTIRTLSENTQNKIATQLETLAKGITQAAGGNYTFRFHKGYPAVINSKEQTDNVLNHASALFGDKAAHHMETPLMIGEDFSFYQRHFPGAFYFVGSGSKKSESTYVWHHPKYNVDDSFFLTAAPLMAMLGLEG